MNASRIITIHKLVRRKDATQEKIRRVKYTSLLPTIKDKQFGWKYVNNTPQLRRFKEIQGGKKVRFKICHNTLPVNKEIYGDLRRKQKLGWKYVIILPAIKKEI